MTKKLSNKSKTTERPAFQKPIIPNFPGTKAPVNFKPTARMGTINRGRR
jgi:hypothetical protein